jgi:hypothetical protein
MRPALQIVNLTINQGRWGPKADRVDPGLPPREDRQMRARDVGRGAAPIRQPQRQLPQPAKFSALTVRSDQLRRLQSRRAVDRWQIRQQPAYIRHRIGLPERHQTLWKSTYCSEKLLPSLKRRRADRQGRRDHGHVCVATKSRFGGP